MVWHMEAWQFLKEQERINYTYFKLHCSYFEKGRITWRVLNLGGLGHALSTPGNRQSHIPAQPGRIYNVGTLRAPHGPPAITQLWGALVIVQITAAWIVGFRFFKLQRSDLIPH